MRVCRIGRAPTALLPMPELERVREAKESDLLGTRREASGSPMSYFPTRKGPSRMEALRRYSHQSMAMLLETDPEVTSWTSKLEPLALSNEGKVVEVFPHFLVQRTDGQQVIRITRSRQFRAVEQHLLETIRGAYADLGVAFQTICERDLLSDSRLPAARTILWHRHWRPSADMAARTAAMSADPLRTLCELQELLGGGEGSWPFVIGLVAHGWVEVDRTSDLSADTAVHACNMGGLE